MTIVSKSYEILICEGVSGLCIYLNDHRIAGRKPLGGGKTIARWTVTATDLARAVPAKWPFVPLASTPEMRDRIRELATPARDDFDRAIAIVLDDFDRLKLAYDGARAPAPPVEPGLAAQEVERLERIKRACAPFVSSSEVERLRAIETAARELGELPWYVIPPIALQRKFAEALSAPRPAQTKGPTE